MNYEEFVQMKYKKYIETLKKEAALNVYLDLTNMFHWQDVLGWRFRIEDVASQLLELPNMNIDFGKFYQGKKTYIKSENPAFGGTA